MQKENKILTKLDLDLCNFIVADFEMVSNTLLASSNEVVGEGANGRGASLRNGIAGKRA